MSYTQAQNIEEEENQIENDDNLAFIKQNGGAYIATYTVLPFGDNFANNGLDFQALGFAVGAELVVFKKINLGLELNFLEADNVNTEALGQYLSTNITSMHLKLGYKIELTKTLEALGQAFIGPVIYNNNFGDKEDDFLDNGTSYGLEAKISYYLNPYFSLFANTGLRFDDLDIEAPSNISNQFDQATYLFFGLGIKFNFINKIYNWELETKHPK